MKWLSFIALLLLFASCRYHLSSDDLVGKWKIVDADVSELSFAKEEMEYTKAKLGMTVYEYRSDGTGTIHFDYSGDELTLDFKWELNSVDERLTILVGGRNTTYDIQTYSEDKYCTIQHDDFLGEIRTTYERIE